MAVCNGVLLIWLKQILSKRRNPIATSDLTKVNFYASLTIKRYSCDRISDIIISESKVADFKNRIGFFTKLWLTSSFFFFFFLEEGCGLVSVITTPSTRKEKKLVNFGVKIMKLKDWFSFYLQNMLGRWLRQQRLERIIS